MPAAPNERKIITDKIVVEKTGKTIEEWFAVLDEDTRFGAIKTINTDVCDEDLSVKSFTLSILEVFMPEIPLGCHFEA